MSIFYHYGVGIVLQERPRVDHNNIEELPWDNEAILTNWSGRRKQIFTAVNNPVGETNEKSLVDLFVTLR